MNTYSYTVDSSDRVHIVGIAIYEDGYAHVCGRDEEEARKQAQSVVDRVGGIA